MNSKILPKDPYLNNSLRYWLLNYYDLKYYDYLKQEFNCRLVDKKFFEFNSEEDMFLFKLRWS